MFKNLQEEFDIILTIIFTLLCIAFVLVSPLNETSVRVVFGLPLVLFLPGYSLMTMLFLGKNDLSGIERTAFSFILSLAIVSLLGLILNFTHFGIRLAPILIVLSIFTISLSLVAWIRRLKLPAEERFRIQFERLLNGNLGQRSLDKGLSIILITSIIGSSVTLAYVAMNPRAGEKFTQFYLLGPNGKASNYPTDLKIGEEGKVIIGVVNHEYENVTYHLEVTLNGSLIHEKQFLLFENEKWENPFTFQATEKGENKKLEFLLYKDQHKEAYRTLHLWIRVNI